MNLFSFLLWLILSFLVSYCHSVKVCDAMRCRRGGSGGKFRPGHRPLKFNEVPYIAVLLHNDKPYCLGMLIKIKYPRCGIWTIGTVVLSTCTCALRETAKYVGFGSEMYDYQIGKLKKHRISNTVLPPNTKDEKKCVITNPYDSTDYAYMYTDDVEYPTHSAHFVTKNIGIYSNYVDTLLEKHENECFGFGFGAYDFIGTNMGQFEHEGSEESILHIYDYRLITDEECEKYVPKCCGKWKDIGGKKEGVKQSRIHCAIRGRENSLCYGLLGSPIICDGYFIGFLKGHLKCSPDSKSYAGPDLFVPMSAEFFVRRGLQLDFSWRRPKPECLEDSVRESEIEEIYPREDGNYNKTLGEGDSQKKMQNKKRDEEDYYYDNAASNFFKQSLEAIALTTISQLILSI